MPLRDFNTDVLVLILSCFAHILQRVSLSSPNQLCSPALLPRALDFIVNHSGFVIVPVVRCAALPREHGAPREHGRLGNGNGESAPFAATGTEHHVPGDPGGWIQADVHSGPAARTEFWLLIDQALVLRLLAMHAAPGVGKYFQPLGGDRLPTRVTIACAAPLVIIPVGKWLECQTDVIAGGTTQAAQTCFEQSADQFLRRFLFPLEHPQRAQPFQHLSGTDYFATAAGGTS